MTDYRTEDYIDYRFQRAKETIQEVETHIQNKYWNTAVNRMYYACFYAVGALLIKHGIDTSTHKGTRQQFGQLFVKTGKMDRFLAKHFSDLYVKRNMGDYNDFFDYNEETVISLFPLTRQFIDKIEELLQE